MKHDVFGIGNALVDVLMHVEHSMIEELGLAKGTLHLLDEQKLIDFEEKVLHLEKKTVAGGSAANTLVGVALLGGSVFFFGKIGDDEHGSFYEEALLKHGVKSGLIKANGATGRAITLITPDFERTFLVHLGTAAKLAKHELLEKDIKDSKFLHIEAYQLEDTQLRETSLEAMRIAKENGVRVSLDLGDPGLVKRNKEDLRSIASDYVDILFANEAEARAFTGKKPKDALGEMSGMADIAIVKLGSKGSIIKQGGKVYKIAGVKANANDTTGAGDIYASGILYGLAHGYCLEASGNLASMLGAKVVEQTGARLDPRGWNEL